MYNYKNVFLKLFVAEVAKFKSSLLGSGATFNFNTLFSGMGTMEAAWGLERLTTVGHKCSFHGRSNHEQALSFTPVLFAPGVANLKA
jgi:hypothetical protein